MQSKGSSGNNRLLCEISMLELGRPPLLRCTIWAMKRRLLWNLDSSGIEEINHKRGGQWDSGCVETHRVPPDQAGHGHTVEELFLIRLVVDAWQSIDPNLQHRWHAVWDDRHLAGPMGWWASGRSHSCCFSPLTLRLDHGRSGRQEEYVDVFEPACGTTDRIPLGL